MTAHEAARHEDRELEAAIRQGRDAVLEVLYRQHAGRAFRYCLRLLGEPAIAEEIAQDAFLRTLGCVGWLRRPAPATLRAYLYRTAHRLAISQLRRRGAEERALQRLERPPAATTASDGIDAARVRAALPLLDATQREVLLLWAEAELPLVEVGRVLSLPESTCRDRFRAALDALARAVGAPGPLRPSRPAALRAGIRGGDRVYVGLARLRLDRER